MVADGGEKVVDDLPTVITLRVVIIKSAFSW